ncbi:hypothetical protein Pcinc_034104, partial [Petrolisthes cinctipes]
AKGRFACRPAPPVQGGHSTGQEYVDGGDGGQCNKTNQKTELDRCLSSVAPYMPKVGLPHTTQQLTNMCRVSCVPQDPCKSPIPKPRTVCPPRATCVPLPEPRVSPSQSHVCPPPRATCVPLPEPRVSPSQSHVCPPPRATCVPLPEPRVSPSQSHVCPPPRATCVPLPEPRVSPSQSHVCPPPRATCVPLPEPRVSPSQSHVCPPPRATCVPLPEPRVSPSQSHVCPPSQSHVCPFPSTRAFKGGMECVDAYTSSCLTPVEQHDLRGDLEGARSFLAFLCDDPVFQKEYLSYGGCLREVSDDWERCHRHYKSLIRLQHKFSNVSQHTRDRNVCCIRASLLSCVYSIAKFRCGRHQALFVKKVTATLSYNDMQESRCKNVTLRTCAGASTSRQQCVMTIVIMFMLLLMRLM